MNLKKHKILTSLLASFLIFSTGCTIFTSCLKSDWSSVAPRNSFVQVLTERKDGMSTGSGIIISHTENSSIILTAGHVCENSDNIYAVDIEENAYISHLYYTSKEDDLCIFATSGKIKFPDAKIAKSSTNKVGRKVWNIAAPLGIHGKNLAVVFEGYYQGNLKTSFSKYDMSLYSVPTRGGSSGSPIFNEDWEIIGVTARGIEEFESVALAVSLERLRKFLNLEDK